MNERIAELYDQAIVLEGNGDYVAGELDPVKFAELIVRECISICENTEWPKNPGLFDHGWDGGLQNAQERMMNHFGVE